MHTIAMCRAVLSATGAAAFMLDARGTVVHATEAALELSGLGRADVDGATWPQLAERLGLEGDPGNPVAEHVSGWPPWPVVVGMFASAAWAADTVVARVARVAAEGEPVGLVSLACLPGDGADSLSLRNREQFCVLFSGAADAVYITDISGRFVEVNDVACARLGYTRSEMLGLSLTDIIAPEYRPLVAARIGRLVTGAGTTTTGAHIRTDGVRIPVEFRSCLVQYGGRPAVLSIARDTVEHRQAEVLLGGGEFLRLLVDNLPVAVFAKSISDRRYTLWNHAAERISGTPAMYVLGKTDEDLLAPDLVARYRAAEDEALRLGAAVRVPDDVIGRPGRIPMVLDSVRAPLLDAKGKPSAIIGISRDVSEAHAAGDALAASNDLLRSVLSGLGQAVLIVEPGTGVIEDANDTAVTMLGYAPDELRGMSVAALRVEEENADCRVLQEAFQGRLTKMVVDRCRVRCRSGREFPAEHSIGPIFRSDGAMDRLVCVIRDVSEQQRAESDERLVAVGHLAAGVAHEFNNILASMLMRAERAELTRSEADYGQLVAQVLKGAARCGEITRRLAVLAGPVRLSSGAVDTYAVLEEAVQAADDLLRDAGITVRRVYEAGLPPIKGDHGQLQQAVYSLVSNACHAMADGGALTVEARRPADDPGALLIRVSDTGVGISPEDLPHVFEPFFTTKGLLAGSEVPGMGLGLGVAHAVVQAHGGTIGIDSLLGRGTVVELRLPAAAASSAVPAPGPPAP